MKPEEDNGAFPLVVCFVSEPFNRSTDMPPTSIPLSTPLTNALDRLQSLTPEEQAVDLCPNSQNRIPCNRLIEHCVKRLIQTVDSNETASLSKPGEIELVCQCLKVIKLAVVALEVNPQFHTSLSAQAGFHHLEKQIDNAESWLRKEHDASLALNLVSTLVHEFAIEGVEIPPSWYEGTGQADEASDSPDDSSGLAAAS